MTTAKIIGAGSIGSHLAHALRTLSVEVTIIDRDSRALERTKLETYPSRYGSFDPEIRLCSPEEVSGAYDICIIGTPPDTHLQISSRELSQGHGVMMIEKPLSKPGLSEVREFLRLCDSSATRVLVGYNQRVKYNTVHFLELLKSVDTRTVVRITSEMREDWAGILSAHPWMANAQESYLSHTALGGGALFENSHATDFALFIANNLGFGRPRRVKASLIETEENGAVFDKEAILQVEMDEGLTLEIGQDLHSWPAKKFLAVSSKDEIYTWRMEPDADHVEYQNSLTDELSTTSFQKTRPDDFIPEMQHLLAILSDNNLPSPIDIHEVWHTALTLEAALVSSRTQEWVDLSELEY